MKLFCAVATAAILDEASALRIGDEALAAVFPPPAAQPAAPPLAPPGGALGPGGAYQVQRTKYATAKAGGEGDLFPQCYPEAINKAAPDPSAKVCQGKVLVVDIGGNSAKVWCFSKDGQPLDIPGIQPTYQIWNGNAKSFAEGNKALPCKEKDLSNQDLKDYAAEFMSRYGKVKKVVCQMAAPVTSPGPAAVSKDAGNLPLLKAQTWATTNMQVIPGTPKRWSAMNDITAGILGGLGYVQRVGRGSQSVISFVFGTSPNGGWARAMPGGQVALAGRMSWMYGRNSEQLASRNAVAFDTNACMQQGHKLYSDFDSAMTAKGAEKAIGDWSYSLPTLHYVPIMEQEFIPSDLVTNSGRELPTILSTDDKTPVTSAQMLEELSKLGYKAAHAGVLPFTYVLRNANLQLLLELRNVRNRELGKTGPEFLTADDMITHVWRQRLTQAAHMFGSNYMAEMHGNGESCEGQSTAIVLLGGNAIPVGGKLHRWAARWKGEAGRVWVDLQGLEPDRRLEEFSVREAIGEMLIVEGTIEQPQPIEMKIDQCNFNIYLIPAATHPRDFKNWGIVHMGGAAVLSDLQLAEEVPQAQFFPWRKASKGGYCTEDTYMTFVPTEDEDGDGLGDGLDLDKMQ